MKALALDLGASGGKMLLGSFDSRLLTIREIHRFANEPVESDGHLFWGIDGIYSNLLEGLRKAASDHFSSFGVDAFCNDYGLLDESGYLMSGVYTYRDPRTEDVLEWMDGIFPPQELYARTGNQRARFNTLVQVAAQTRAGDRHLLEQAKDLLFVPDLFNFFLCGEKAAEFTIASVSQLYNRKEGRWDPHILQAFGVRQELFPPVIPSSTKLGEAKANILERTGCAPFSICTVGHHDTASAVAAVPSLDKHFAYISNGTWSLMGTETEEMITSDAAFRDNFANEGSAGGRNRFLKNIMGLWLLQECRRQLEARGSVYTFEELEREAEKAVPFRSIINPDDPLFFEPGDMIGKIQAKCREWKQPMPETPGELSRCILESLALVYRATLAKLEALTGSQFPCVHIIGGGARNELLNRFAASAMRRPVLAGPYDASALGNLCAQFIAAGEISGWDEARQVVKGSLRIREFLPEAEADWDEAYRRFVAIKSGNSA